MTGWISRWRLKPTAFIWAKRICLCRRPENCWWKEKIIGLTVHSVEKAQQAEAAGADYLGVSPIYPTRTKLDAGRPAGIQLIRQIKAVVKIPLGGHRRNQPRQRVRGCTGGRGR